MSKEPAIDSNEEREMDDRFIRLSLLEQMNPKGGDDYMLSNLDEYFNKRDGMFDSIMGGVEEGTLNFIDEDRQEYITSSNGQLDDLSQHELESNLHIDVEGGEEDN